MVQKPIKCCSETPAFQITYSVSGSEKDYFVCSECIKKECFSKYIIRRHILENNKKIFQNDQSELIDESSVVSELNDEHVTQNEQNNDHGGFIL